MIKVHIAKRSAIGWFTSRGVKERPEAPEWAADQEQRPFNQREYGFQFKTMNRGAKKRV